jgi:Na+/proline symporter/nitrogen-specific signal transduction histidine kinase
VAGPFIFALLILYLLALLLVAWRVERSGPGHRAAHRRGVVYALSLAVLCSSWTYFGAAGSAMQGAWSYIPNFLGPILAITIFFPIWRRIAVAAKKENVGSIADFLASRYGKSRTLGTLIACVSIIGALPYIALQLTSLSKVWAVVAGQSVASPLATPVIVALLAFMAILLGARRPTLTHHNRGLVRIVAIESTVKIVALLTVAGLATTLLWQRDPTTLGRLFAEVGPPPALDLQFVIATILCMVTAVTLPRQFHLGFVELEDVEHLKTARWAFPLYMVIWSLAVVPIAVAGKLYLQGWSDPDTAVLGLPITHAGPGLTAFIFLGGFSAGAAMVMVETVALSAMISNELVLPWLSRTRWGAGGSTFDAGRRIVYIRRIAIVGVLLLAWLYFTTISRTGGLARLGFSSLAASAQLFPALVGAVLWRRGHARGAIWGIAGGMAVWLGTVVAPQVPALGFDHFPLGFDGGILASLVLNVAIYVSVSLRTAPRLIDRIQASTFINQGQITPDAAYRGLEHTIGELRTLIEQFLGREDSARAFEDLERRHGRPFLDGDPVSPAIARAAERMLAGAIGASSARNVIALALAGADQQASDISRMLDEAAQAVQFGRELLQTSLESLDQGVCVVDRDVRLVAWNSRYVELFEFDAGEIYIGKPLEELIRQTAPLGVERQDQIAALIEERIGPMRRREPQTFERDWANGLTLRVTGVPIGSGEYVTSFTDVTELRATARELAQSNELLEQRVSLRTLELTQANAALAEAKGQAERVTNAQARFVAAASHDLLQPLHAARLFLGAAGQDLSTGNETRDLVCKADISIEAADRLLRALLNLSRLEGGGISPDFAPVNIDDLLAGLSRDFDTQARSKGLNLVIMRAHLSVMSDPDLLRSVLQNLVGNAVRYTPKGGRIVIGCRRAGDSVRIEVHDNGPGIDEAELPRIFEEFSRLPSPVEAEAGVGLGLAIADRICRTLGHKLDVSSALGKGSVFSVTAKRCEPAAAPLPAQRRRALPRDLHVLCIDDEPAVLDALSTLLRRWNVRVSAAHSLDEVKDLHGPWDVVLADYQLGPGPTGLDFLTTLRGKGAILALVTAKSDDRLMARAADLGVEVFRKPLSPAPLRAFLTRAAAYPAGAASVETGAADEV